MECSNCHGEGEVGFNRSIRNDPQCADFAPCPVCNGTGEIEEACPQCLDELGRADIMCPACGREE